MRTHSMRRHTVSISRSSVSQFRSRFEQSKIGFFKARRTEVCRALTLLELTLVVALLGIFAAIAVTSFGHASLANAGARGYARKLALDLVQAQRRAISTGDNHYIEFQSSGGVTVGHTLYRRAGGSTIVADVVRNAPHDVTVTPSHNLCEYTFEGSALASYTCSIAGPNRSWQITVTAATGAVRVTDSP